ncbi:hypothetical protein [Pantoea sp. PNT03]|jgi:hypothetical protein|uniref:hypothetical protein n=1 Tax=Pantoea sp. PNT03 TaxID=2769258 RepID=UPI0017842B6E|nr:hypothetical protein [Pantoea sp. PNT03]MBD9661450.1 hypothetical protein [Pantoea sp. PNT03]
MSDIMMTNRIVQIHLASWRYFAALTLPPLALILSLFYFALSLPLMVLFFITHYYCWRLWLDERLFALLNNEDDLAEFDRGMAQLWPKKFARARSLADRLHVTRVMFYRAMISLLVLWLASLCSVSYLALTLGE